MSTTKAKTKADGAESASTEGFGLSDDMLPMVGSSGGKFAMKFNQEHQQHGWIFYDNHGQWVTLRRALPYEIERAKQIIEMRKVLAGVPCRA